ncbi:hypothetical protein [Novosphingobium sp.]|uniref:hypothetical protein n=1 Tax=Novosphingobium sp. TaxID=1874826 RepID=UPI00286A4FB0|nr:hypothetical protein [Novosphingobium sp.]
MGEAIDRRGLLGSASAAIAAALAGPIALPAALERVLPAPLRALMPDAAQEAAGLIAELLRLEEEAKALRLPASPLQFGTGGVPLDPAQLYQAAMPRLVALIDRAERRAPFLADKAGALLAKLHHSEYVVPELWLGNTAPRLALPLDADEPLTLPEPQLPGAPLEVPGGVLPALAAPLSPVSPSHVFAEIAGEYSAWFAAAEIRPEHRDSADWHLTMMRQSRPRYAALGKQVGVPWQFLAAIHGLEASFNFRAHLHNGDYPLGQRTRQVPAGRPRAWLPPSSWEASALDALRLMGFAGQDDWSLPRMLYRLEAYNGFGYRHARRASPYLWSFSTLYTRGKFIADGRFDPAVRSRQCGAAVMLKVLDLAGELD